MLWGLEEGSACLTNLSQAALFFRGRVGGEGGMEENLYSIRGGEKNLLPIIKVSSMHFGALKYMKCTTGSASLFYNLPQTI